MSINIKKYTKDQMAKMVEDAQSAQKEAEDAATTYFEGAKKLSEHISKMETRERDLRAKNAALIEQISQMNGENINHANEIANLKADADALRNYVTEMVDRAAFECRRADYAEAHPWRNLWAWVKRKLKMA